MVKESLRHKPRHKSVGFWRHFADICEFSWRSMLAHPWALTFLFVLNIGFIFVFSAYQSPLGDKITYTAQLLANLFTGIVQSTESGGIVGTVSQATLLDVLFGEPLFQRLVMDLIWLFALLAAVTYIVYAFFQSTSVRMVGWMVIDRQPFSIWTFVKINLVWYLLYVFTRVVIFGADLAFSFAQKTNGQIDDLGFVYVVLHLLLFYFVFISYSFTKNRRVWRAIKCCFKYGVKKSHYYVLNFLPIALFLIPYTHSHLIAPILNILKPLNLVGDGLQLAILFMFYTFFMANNFAITYEIASDVVGEEQ